MLDPLLLRRGWASSNQQKVDIADCIYHPNGETAFMTRTGLTKTINWRLSRTVARGTKRGKNRPAEDFRTANLAPSTGTHFSQTMIPFCTAHFTQTFLLGLRGHYRQSAPQGTRSQNGQCLSCTPRLRSGRQRGRRFAAKAEEREKDRCISPAKRHRCASRRRQLLRLLTKKGQPLDKLHFAKAKASLGCYLVGGQSGR